MDAPTFTFPALVELNIEIARPSGPINESELRRWSPSSLRGFFCDAMRGHEQDPSFEIIFPCERPADWTTCAAEVNLPLLTTVSFPAAAAYFFPEIFLAPKLSTISITEPSWAVPEDHLGFIFACQPTPHNIAILAGIRRLDLVCCSCDSQCLLEEWLGYMPNLERLSVRCVHHHLHELSGLPFDPESRSTVVARLALSLSYTVHDNQSLGEIDIDGMFFPQGELVDMVKERKAQGSPLRKLVFKGQPLSASECAELYEHVDFHHIRTHTKFRAVDGPLCGCPCSAGKDCPECARYVSWSLLRSGLTLHSNTGSTWKSRIEKFEILGYWPERTEREEAYGRGEPLPPL